MTEEEATIRYLVEEVGADEHEARLRLVDDDLWISDPAVRSGLEGEEAVREWELS